MSQKSRFSQEFTPRLVSTLKQGYSFKVFLADLFAGITVGIVALPLAMAFAIASGVGPEKGLVTAVIAGFLISALGGSRVQIGGPTGAFVVIIYGIIQIHGYEGLVTATVMAGVILIVLGLARFGRMIKFIPYPVTTGFTSGIALIIFSGQVKDFLGLQIESVPSDFIEKWRIYFANFDSVNPSAVFLAGLTLIIIILMRKFWPRLPSAFIAIIITCTLVGYLKLPVETIGSRFGEIPGTLPMPVFPAFSFEAARHLIPEAITIALLAGIESLLSAVVADGMTSDKHNSNCELVAQGVANLASVSFGGIPATGAIARTATNIRSGAQTPVAGMIHSIVLLFLILLFAPYAGKIPMACLAAILFIVAWNMAEIKHFRYLLRAPTSDVIILLVTFALTVLIDLTVAVQVGVVMASLSFMKRMSEVSDVISSSPVFQDEIYDFSGKEVPAALLRKDIPHSVEVFQLSGPFFFGVADRLKDVLSAIEEPPEYFVLRMRKVPAIDGSGLYVLQDLYDKCRKQGIILMLSGVQPEVADSLRRIGLWELIGSENICANIDAALEKINRIRQQKLS